MTQHPPIPRSVLVTGCSSGIGRACADILRERGWTVYACARKTEDLQNLRDAGYTALELDLADPDSIESCVSRVHDLGVPGALVNNAGYGHPGAVEDATRDDLRRQFEVNVFGLQDLTNRLLPAMRERGSGRVVNIGSILGLIVTPNMGIYCASKYALEALTDALRIELCDSGIHACLIGPGPVRSSFRDRLLESGREQAERQDPSDPERQRQMLQHAEDTVKRNANMAGPECVVRHVVHALESPHPRPRYHATWQAHLIAASVRLLPKRAVDALLRRRQRSRQSS